MTKQNQPESNYLAIPPNISGILRQSGLMFYCYYANVRSGPKRNFELRTFDFYCLLQMVDGDGIFADDIHPVPVEIPSGGGLIVTPAARHQYGAGRNYFVEDSICFYGPAADAFFRAGIIRQGLINFGSERVLLPIIEKLRTGLLTDYLQANVMVQQLLIDLHWRNNVESGSQSSNDMEHLLKRINRNPHEVWGVRKMAEFCGISENHLRRLFHRRIGLAPKQYVEQLKMRNAAELLVGTELKISEIASKLGYDDPYHFIRRFTEKTGIAPGRYRRKQKERLLH